MRSTPRDRRGSVLEQSDRPGPPAHRWSSDAQAFALMFEEHGGAVFNVAARWGGGARAADVTQDVFARLWRQPDRFDPTRGSLRTFLLSVARNVAIDQARSDSSRGAREQRHGRAQLRAELSSGPADLAVLHDDADRLLAALDRLPTPIREAVVTAFYGRLTYREAADVLGVPEGTIKSRIRVGLRQLRTELATSETSLA